MFGEWRRRRAIQRIKPGDGRPLKRFRWWPTLGSSERALRLRYNRWLDTVAD